MGIWRSNPSKLDNLFAVYVRKSINLVLKYDEYQGWRPVFSTRSAELIVPLQNVVRFVFATDRKMSFSCKAIFCSGIIFERPNLYRKLGRSLSLITHIICFFCANQSDVDLLFRIEKRAKIEIRFHLSN